LSLLNKKFKEMGYFVTVQLVNAASYGTPQKRERVVFIGSRDGLQVHMPLGAYGPSENLYQKRWKTLGEALAGLNEVNPEYIPFSQKRAAYLARLKEGENWRRNMPGYSSFRMTGYLLGA
jgi:DNA (cytosine-5)-methyltransferase 1